MKEGMPNSAIGPAGFVAYPSEVVRCAFDNGGCISFGFIQQLAGGRLHAQAYAAHPAKAKKT